MQTHVAQSLVCLHISCSPIGVAIPAAGRDSLLWSVLSPQLKTGRSNTPLWQCAISVNPPTGLA